MKNIKLIEKINLYAGTEGSGGNLQEKVDPVLKQFFDIGKIVIPVILAIGALLIIIKMIMLGIKLAQSGDDPEQRSRVIKGMVWWGIGLLVLIVAIAVSATLFTILAPGQ